MGRGWNCQWGVDGRIPKEVYRRTVHWNVKFQQDSYFLIISEVHRQYDPIHPEKIWNLDETGEIGSDRFKLCLRIIQKEMKQEKTTYFLRPLIRLILVLWWLPSPLIPHINYSLKTPTSSAPEPSLSLSPESSASSVRSCFFDSHPTHTYSIPGSSSDSCAIQNTKREKTFITAEQFQPYHKAGDRKKRKLDRKPWKTMFAPNTAGKCY